MRRAAAIVLAVLGLDASAAQDEKRLAIPQQLFTPPPAGSYALPPIQQAPRGTVVDDQGRSRSLAGYLTGHVTLLSFIYTHCTDPAGCPLAIATLAAVRERLAARPETAKAQLVSLSFDPQYDTPDVMRLFSKTYDSTGKKKPQWHFLTTASASQLAPLLEGFGQDAGVSNEPGPRRLDHTLRVFLIDPRSRVREIYSSAYLMPEVIVNDILTLEAER